MGVATRDHQDQYGRAKTLVITVGSAAQGLLQYSWTPNCAMSVQHGTMTSELRARAHTHTHTHTLPEILGHRANFLPYAIHKPTAALMYWRH